jgi:hypothetical protein
MDAAAAVALATAAGHALPSGLAAALARVAALEAENAALRAERDRLQAENAALELAGREGRMPFAPGGGPVQGTWDDALRDANAHGDLLEDEADRWYERYARATRCPPRPTLIGPYLRPRDRPNGYPPRR